MDYQTSEKRIRREFDQFGDIKKIKIIKDKEGKPRGYAFIEFEHKKDMIQAYKLSDGIRLDGRRLIVDIERGRTQLDFIPRKFGGGIGDTRKDYDLISESRSRSRSTDKKRKHKTSKSKKTKSKKDKKDKKKRKSSLSRSRSPYSRSPVPEENREHKEKKAKKEKKHKRSFSLQEERDKDR